MESHLGEGAGHGRRGAAYRRARHLHDGDTTAAAVCVLALQLDQEGQALVVCINWTWRNIDAIDVSLSIFFA